MAKCSLDINKKHWISPIFLWLRRTAVTCSTQWQILKCNLKFVPVSNLIESQPPAAEASLSDNKDSACCCNWKIFQINFFHFFFPKLDPDSYYDDNFKIFSVLVWNLKSKNERNLIFSAGNKNTDGAGLVTGQCLCLHCCCCCCRFMFDVYDFPPHDCSDGRGVRGDPPVCLGWIILTWHRFSVCCISVSALWGVRATRLRLTEPEPELLIMMCIEGSELISRY